MFYTALHLNIYVQGFSSRERAENTNIQDNLIKYVVTLPHKGTLFMT